MTAIEVSPKEMKKLADKTNEKRKREDDDDDDEVVDDNEVVVDKKAQRKDAKKELMDQVPETDEHGIAYSKLQRRRMMKRVKRGLAPVPTQAEEDERLRQEKQLKREEEDELAGMMYNDNQEEEKDDNEEQEDDDDEPMQNVDDDKPKEDPNKFAGTKASEYTNPTKKKKRSKPVPVDYVCSACKNKHEPIHWIYDCPDKVTVRGTNGVSKSTKGNNDPDDKKVFVSGLPFEAKRKDVEALFSSCGKLLQCKLLTFPDTGRCKGQAYLTFETEEEAKKAVALSGTTIDNKADDNNNKKTKKGETIKAPARNELKLKVSKMLSRTATKQGSR